MDGEETYEMIAINWVSADSNGYLYRSGSKYWYGSQTNVKRILRYEVEAGACRIQKN